MGANTMSEWVDIPDKNLLAALIKQESGGRNNTVSRKGARGLTQVMPATAADPGYGVKPLRDNSPGEYERFGSDYLGAMLTKYNGNKELALAAYNAGPGAVDKAGGVPKYKETQDYIKKILGSINPISTASASETPYGHENDWIDDPAPQANTVTPLDDGWVDDAPNATNDISATEQPVMYGGRNVSDLSGPAKFLIGTGNAAMNLGRGAMQLTGLAGDTGFGSQQDVAESRKLGNELDKSGSGMAGGLFGSIAPAVMTGGTTLPALIGSGAGFGALQPTLGDESRVSNAGYGAAGALIGKGITSGIGKAVKGFIPSDSARALMSKGIQPTVGQGIKQDMLGKGIRKAEEATTSLPFLGAITKNARDRGLKEWTQKVIGEAESIPLGINAKGAVGHEAIANLKAGFNQAYEKALAGHKLKLDNNFASKIGSDIQDKSLLLNDAERKQITGFVQGRFDAATPDKSGRYLASDIRKIESDIGDKIRTLPVGDERRQLLEKIKDSVVKHREDMLPPEVGKQIKEINAKYANFVRLRDAAKGVGAENGEFSPAQLYNRSVMMDKSGKASSGNALMQKLAGQGKAVLSDKLGDSGTAPRMLTNKLLTGGAIETAAAIADLPKTALLGGAMALGSTRPAQKALLGGYAAQKQIGKGVNKLAPLIAAGGAKAGYNKGKKN